MSCHFVSRYCRQLIGVRLNVFIGNNRFHAWWLPVLVFRKGLRNRACYKNVCEHFRLLFGTKSSNLCRSLHKVVEGTVMSDSSRHRYVWDC